MKRTKWMPFTAPQPTTRDAQKSAKPEVTPLPTLEIKKFGLENFGNTCYANSVLQALFFCAPFRDLMLQQPDASITQDILTAPPPPPSPTPAKPPATVRRKPERKASTSQPADLSLSSNPQSFAIPMPTAPPTLFSALRSLFHHISTQPGDKGTVAPKAFIDKLKEINDVFRGTMHQDAHEFLNFLLNQIVEDMVKERRAAQSATQAEELAASVATVSSQVPTVATAASSGSGAHLKDATLVHKLFEGVLTSETRCLTCETVSARDESFLDLSIDIEQNSSVTACLRHFSASEMLCQKNKFFCDSCCDLQEAEKRMKIKKLPNVLALHLKRFKYQEALGRYIKLTYRVAFPMELRLFNTVDDMENADRLYNLFAIVVHIGTGPHQGHYISIIKTGGSWFVFDDDSVYPIVESDITKYFGDSNSGSAYVLYYQAVDIDLKDLGLETPKEVSATSTLPSEHTTASTTDDKISAPPGLDPEQLASNSSEETAQSTIPQPHLVVPEKPQLTIKPTNGTALSNSSEQQPSSVPSSIPSPASPGFGTKLFNTLRRAPSSSLPRTSISSPTPNGTEKKRPPHERSSASSPSLLEKENGNFFEPPPPVPPLPPTTQTLEPPKPTILTPSDDKEKPRKETTKSGGGWFSKRKSLKLSDKPKSHTREPTSPLPPSPARKTEDSTHSQSSTWYNPFASRESQSSERGHARNLSFDAEKSRLKKGSSKQHLSVNGTSTEDTPPTPGSTTSSLTSTSVATQASLARPSANISSSSTSSIPSASRQQGSNSSIVDHRKSKDSRSSSPSASRAWQKVSSSSSKDYDNVPPLPSTPVFVSHVHSPSNGDVFTAEPMSITNGHTNGQAKAETNGRTSLSDDDATSHLRSSTLPPPSSIAEPPNTNLSTGSTSSQLTPGSGLRRATRKLSLTAPMLGFGRREKKAS